jgi:hypothetical protein
MEQVTSGNMAGVEELYKALERMRLYFVKQIGLERAEDAYHNVF